MLDKLAVTPFSLPVTNLSENLPEIYRSQIEKFSQTIKKLINERCPKKKPTTDHVQSPFDDRDIVGLIKSNPSLNQYLDADEQKIEACSSPEELKAKKIEAAGKLVGEAEQQIELNSVKRKTIANGLSEALSIYIFLEEKDRAHDTLEKLSNFLFSLIRQKKCSASAASIAGNPGSMFTRKSCNEKTALSSTKECTP